MSVKLKKQKQEVVTRTIEEVVVIEATYSRLGYYRLRDPETIEEAAAVPADEWRDDGNIVYLRKRDGRVVVTEIEEWDEEQDWMFVFTKDTAEKFISVAGEKGSKDRARAEQGQRGIRLQSNGTYLFGQAPCGAFFRITRAEAKKLGEAVLKEWYS